jgi:predicted ATPase
MTVRRIRVSNYRSLRDLQLELGPVTILVGENGCGKSNLYRAIQLLHAAAVGRLAEAFAAEGGMPSVLWAGTVKKRSEIREVRMTVGVELDHVGFRLACGLPIPRDSLFKLDPEVKEEDVTVRISGRMTPVSLCERRSLVVTVRNDDAQRVTYSDPLDLNESILSQLADSQRFPELALIRQTLQSWRFYHQFRTDHESPLRQPRFGVRSPVLAHDGTNLVAAMQTVLETDHGGLLEKIISTAFPGCATEIRADDRGFLALRWRMPGLNRSLTAGEVSDGTLRFLALATALLSPRPPTLLVLNEPETSLHPDVLPALAELIAHAASQCQVVLTTHSLTLAEAVAAQSGCPPTRLVMKQGATTLADDPGPLAGRHD